MKKIIFSFFLFLLFPFSPYHVFAHPACLPPFFKANGQFNKYYHVPLQSDIINLPQSDIDGTFIVNIPITFEIDPNLLPFPKNIVNTLKYSWDFGDGGKGEGFKNTHTYREPGSYIFRLNAEPKPTYVSQTDLESVLINVLPDPNYSVVTPTIVINGFEIKDSITDTFEDDIGTKELKFEAEIHNSKIILTKNGGVTPKTSTRLVITPQPQTNSVTKKISDISYSLVRYVAQPTGGILFLLLAIVAIFIGGGLHALTP